MPAEYTPSASELHALIDGNPYAVVVVPGKREELVFQEQHPGRDITTPPAIVGRLARGRRRLKAEERRIFLRQSGQPAELLLVRQWAYNRESYDQLPPSTLEALTTFDDWRTAQEGYEFEDLPALILSAPVDVLYPTILAVEAQQYSPLVRQLLERVSQDCLYAGDPGAATLRRYGAGDLVFPGAPNTPPTRLPDTLQRYGSPTELAARLVAEIRLSSGPQHNRGLVLRGQAETPYLLDALRLAGIPTSSETYVDSFHTPLARVVRLYLQWLVRPQIRQALRGPDAGTALPRRLSSAGLETLLTSPLVGLRLDDYQRWLHQARTAAMWPSKYKETQLAAEIGLSLAIPKAMASGNPCSTAVYCFSYLCRPNALAIRIITRSCTNPGLSPMRKISVGDNMVEKSALSVAYERRGTTKPAVFCQAIIYLAVSLLRLGGHGT